MKKKSKNHWNKEDKKKLRFADKEKILENVVRHALKVVLLVNFFCLVFISFIDPEAYFFGEKLVGINAIIYLSTRGIVGLIIAYFLFKKKSEAEVLSLAYFGYFFLDILITNLYSGFGLLISPLMTIGLVVSIVLLVVRKFNQTRIR